MSGCPLLRNKFPAKELADGNAVSFDALALDPGFSRTPHLYVLVQMQNAGFVSNKVFRLTVNASSTQVVARKELLSDQHSTSSFSKPDGGRSGGALRFGPDGLLYVGLGDAGQPFAPQSGASLLGKVIRIDRDGRPAPDVKPVRNLDPRVYVSGVRDPAAFAFHVGSGALLMGERRGDRPDDLTLMKSATNLGWNPECARTKTGYCESVSEQVPVKELPVRPSIWHGQRVGDGISAVLRLDDERWMSWRYAFVIAFDNAQRLDIVKLNAAGEVVQASTALEKLGVGFKSVAAAPNGLYVLTRGKPEGEEIWHLFAH